MCDSKGLLTTTRTVGDLNGLKKLYAKNIAPIDELAQVVKAIKPSVNFAKLQNWSFYGNYFKMLKF